MEAAEFKLVAPLRHAATVTQSAVKSGLVAVCGFILNAIKCCRPSDLLPSMLPPFNNSPRGDFSTAFPYFVWLRKSDRTLKIVSRKLCKVLLHFLHLTLLAYRTASYRHMSDINWSTNLFQYQFKQCISETPGQLPFLRRRLAEFAKYP